MQDGTPTKQPPHRYSIRASEERESDHALYLSVLRILLTAMTPEQRATVDPKVRAVCEEFGR